MEWMVAEAALTVGEEVGDEKEVLWVRLVTRDKDERGEIAPRTGSHLVAKPEVSENEGAVVVGEEFEYRVAPREGGRKFAVESRPNPHESWDTEPFRFGTEDAARAHIAKHSGAPGGPGWPE